MIRAKWFGLWKSGSAMTYTVNSHCLTQNSRRNVLGFGIDVQSCRYGPSLFYPFLLPFPTYWPFSWRLSSCGRHMAARRWNNAFSHPRIRRKKKRGGVVGERRPCLSFPRRHSLSQSLQAVSSSPPSSPGSWDCGTWLLLPQDEGMLSQHSLC